jgi:hypothetical protein
VILNVLDFADPAEALAAAMDGDVVYFPGQRDYVAPSGAWVVQRSIEIRGDGPFGLRPHEETIISAMGQYAFVVATPDRASSVLIRSLRILLPDGVSSSGVLVRPKAGLWMIGVAVSG